MSFESGLVFVPDGWGGPFRVGGGAEGGEFEDGSEGACDLLGYVRDGYGVLDPCWEFPWLGGDFCEGGRAFGWIKWGSKCLPL